MIAWSARETIDTRKRKPGYEPVMVSEELAWTTSEFIDFFLTTHKYAVTPSNRELLRAIIRRYPGPRPIQAEELAAFLSHRLAK